jgi:hypothetical protein
MILPRAALALSCLLACTSALAVCGGASPTWTAASCTATEVNLCITASSPGDTINVPAGSCSWTGISALTGRRLLGPGKDAGSPTTITAGELTMTKHATQNTRLSGFRFTSTTSAHLAIGGNASDAPFVVDDNYFASEDAEIVHVTTNGGIFFGNTFFSTATVAADVMLFNLGGGSAATIASWQAAPTMGTDDTTGLNNTYFEDNTISGFWEVAADCDNGAKLVFRHNVFTDSGITAHGGADTNNQDSSSHGCRHLEIYDNTFDRVSNSIGLNQWTWWRGNGGVWANNAVDNADSPDGTSYPNKPELRLTVGCVSQSHPVGWQVGQLFFTTDATPDKPLLLFGNTGYGLQDIAIGENPAHTCSSPATFIQSGRDYMTSNSWTWTPYTYPHPLRGGSPPSTPTNFRFLSWLLPLAGLVLLGGIYGQALGRTFRARRATVALSGRMGA